MRSEVQQRSLFGTRVRKMLLARQYDRLELLADSLARTNETFADGTPRIATFFSRGFGELDDDHDGTQWAAHLQALRDWVEERPESQVARIALANGLVSRGWTARGTLPGVAVSATHGQQLVSDCLEAFQMLDQVDADPPLRRCWLYTDLHALNGIGPAADSTFRVTVRAASRLFPDDPEFYIMMTRHLMKRWYGQPGEWEAFADSCAGTLPDSTRDEIYAQILADQAQYTPNVFALSPGLSWERARRGLHLWVRHNPSSLEPKSARAMLAWMRGDRPEALNAFRCLADTVDIDVWNNYSIFWTAQDWAYSGAQHRRS
jgi:hypothetical protein